MADTNLFDQGLESHPAVKTTPTASGNLFDQGLTGGGGGSASVPSTQPVSSNLLDAGLGSPNNGQPAETKKPPEDENAPWYKRAGDFIGTPLVDFEHAMSPEGSIGKAFGRTSEAGGFERGAENIVSGFTAPLSIALTLGTFGTGGLLESAGMTALKASGEFGAEELPQILKAAQVAVDAYKAAPESATAIADAVKAAGVDPALWNRAQSFLYDNGLSEHDLLGGDLMDRGAFQILRKVVPDLSVAATARAAKTAKELMSAGFTYQQLESASAMSPRFLDAIKEGDSDKAWEYGTEMFTSGALGILGASHALHSAGELFKPLIENDAFRPNDHWLQIDRANKEREAQHAVAEQEAINLDRATREILGHADPGFLETVFGGSEEAKNRKNLELATVFHNVVTGGDRVKAAQWYNTLSEALGHEDRLPVPGEPGPNNGQPSVGQVNVESAPGAEFAESLPGYAKATPEEKATYHQEKMQIVKDALRASGFQIVGEDTGHGYRGGASNPVTGFHIAGDAATVESAAKLVHQVLGDQNSIGYTIPRGPSLEGNELEFNFEHPLTAEEVSKIGKNLDESGVSAYPEASDPRRLRIINYSGEHAAPDYTNGIVGLVQDAVPGRTLSPITKQTESGLVEQGTPSPIADKARQAVGELNRERGFNRSLGTPTPPPTREGTKVVHSNDAGEVRVGADGRPVVWLSPEAWDNFRKANNLSPVRGASFSPANAEEISSNLSNNKQIQDLFDTARKTSPQGLLTTGRNNVDVQVASEEIHHTWQRELSQDGEIANLFKPVQWKKLYDIIPPDWQKKMDADAYHEDPVVRVAETAAQFRSGKASGIVPDTDIVRFLDAFYNEIEATHGKSAVEAADKINDIAAQHIKDINENRRERSTAEASELANRQTDSGKLPRVEAGRQAGTPKVGSGEPQEGLASREEEQEFGKLSRLRLRGGMGDPNSAGLITGDNEVFVGDYHEDLAKEAGYKEPAKGPGNIHDAFFRDGGVRIRGAGGVVHIDFMDPNADTWDRVYQAIQSVPDANRYYVDFRPIKNGTGFNIDAYDKDSLVYRLKDLEEGKERPAAPGSVAYFRNGLFSREEENAPQWYLKSNSLIDSRMQGPMPADTVLKMLENNGVKPDELKWSGISEFLRDKGKEKVTPEELRKELATGAIGITDVTKGDSETRFGIYQLPGGTNYHELMLTIPREGMGTSMQDWNVPLGHQYGDDLADHRRVGHVRFNDRVGPNGEKLLHLEELQSDWHQTGRTRGYNLDPTKIESLRKEASDLRERLTEPVTDEELADYFKPGHIVNSYGGKDKVISFHPADPNGTGWDRVWGVKVHAIDPKTGELDPREYDRTHSTRPDAKDVHPEMQARLNEISKETLHSGVPDAPFKKTWPELLMKRMVRYAAEHGYDGVSWTPGEEQAARYDLSKQVDSIFVNPNAGGPRTVRIDVKGDGVPVKMMVNSDGTVEGYGSGAHQLQGKKLDEVVGKEVAQKIMDVKSQTTLDGSDLRVGGEGMKGFYDKIVPELANKLGKQFGAKVGETKIDTEASRKGGTYTGPNKTVYELMDFSKDRNNNGESRDQAEQVKDAMMGGTPFAQAMISFGSQGLAQELGGELDFPTEKATVPHFPITDSMRESVLKQGQPLFSKESPNNGQDPQLQHQIDTNVFKNQPKDYQDLVMDSLRRNARGELSDREVQASKKLRDEQDRNYEIGSSNDLLHHYIEDYMTRVYKDTNPAGKLILSDAKGGKFATNVTMAKQRVYDSNLTALLKSPKQMLLDPVSITARGRASLIKAAANRQLIDTLRDRFTRASDGRPAVVLSGSGQVISGQNGEDPSIFVDPNRVRKINIDPKVIEGLSASGDLDRYLANGTIRDITPYVRPNNIGAAVDRLEEQAGKRTPAPDEHGQNPLRTQIMLLKSMQANGDFRGLKDFNDALEKKYAWDPQDYVSLANNAMKGWNFITNSPDGTPVYVRSDIKVHPEFAEYLQNRLGLAPSDIAKNPVGKALLGVGTKLKHTLLSLSPFHMVQEALRGIMVGVNPIGALRDAISRKGPNILEGERIDPSDPNSPTILYKLVENNLTTGTDYEAQQSNSEGLSSGGGILNNIPGVGKVIGNSLNWYQDFLFKRYIPALKARAGELMYHEYQRMHPDWSVDRIAKAAALHTNDTFGGINWKAMGRSATTQDWGRLMFLAPDWLESEMRSGARLFNKDEGGLGRAQVAKMALGMWGIARVLNLVTTGNAHYEAPFGLATKNKEGKETIFSIRTLPTDLLHAASDPVGFIKGRLSPTVRMGQELVSGRDQFGRKLQPSDLWVDVFRNMAPIPLQAVGQAMSGQGPEIGNVGQIVKGTGGTATVYRTPAQKMAADLASDHTESGPVDPASMERHRRIIQLEDQARAGEINWADLYKLTYATDQLHPDELKKIEMVVKETQGMDPGTAALYSRASRLPAKDYLDLLDVMNNSERAALAPLTLKTQKKYLNKAKKDETPEERAKDPVFQRFLNMVPGQRPGPISQAAPPIPAPVQQEAAHLYRAINPSTGHRIVHDGSQWRDAETGVAV